MNQEIITPEFEVLPPEVAEASTALSAPANKVATLFLPFQKPLENAAALLLEEEQADTAEKARALRLKMVKARTAITATKDESKSDIKLAGSIIDWFHNKGRDTLSAAESRLKAIEEAEARAEAARKLELKTKREAELSKYGVDGRFYSLGEMPEEGYVQLLESSRAAFVARAEAEAKAAEEARQAAEKAEAERVQREAMEAAERARIAAENARLKAEAESAAAAAKVEREKLEAEAKKARELAAAIEKAAREAREKAEAEARALREADEARVKAEAEAAKALAKAAAKAARAPDKDKLVGWAASIRGTPIPKLKSPEAAAIGVEISERISKLVAWIEKQAEDL